MTDRFISRNVNRNIISAPDATVSTGNAMAVPTMIIAEKNKATSGIRVRLEMREKICGRYLSRPNANDTLVAE